MQFCKTQVRAVKPKPTDWGISFSIDEGGILQTLIVISALSNTSTLTPTLKSGWTQAGKSDSTSAITRHVDYGYAVTSHSSQEQTADRVLVHVGTEKASCWPDDSRAAHSQ
jgi:hypothetical protein